ncbi:L,D-transpeptidase family protein [Sphingobium sp. BYY-5]|nr:L,D-transpeptidase family protein [Sphingobium sp. BYY-5]MCI4592455.1 L,D-transpeptidase family protein [Sphingobium sp. BYY-5]
MAAADAEGLGAVTADVPAVRAALTNADEASLDAVATAAAVRLLTAHRQGCCNAALRSGWHISEDRVRPDVHEAVTAAVAQDQLDQLFESARPLHPFYDSLRRAYAQERNPARRATLAANLDRWRWMPRDLGARYLLVNTAAFEATLWQGREMIGRWAVVVGKTKSPTPVFRAQVTGVTFNPWWEIPPRIAAESIAGMIAARPTEAARKGYVLQNGRYRQRPGLGNALGRMKLAMPNGYNVYLHDTPAQALFARDVRAYSHGCVRVGDALGLATALLSLQDDWDRARVDALVASGRTSTVPLVPPMPVYIAYFTAEPDGAGGIRLFPDIYHRDRGASAPGGDGTCSR